MSEQDQIPLPFSDLDPSFMNSADAHLLRKLRELRRRAEEMYEADPEDVRIAELLELAATTERELRNAYAEPHE